MKKLNTTGTNQGFILITLLFSILFIVTLGAITTQLVISNLQLASVERYRVSAQFAADAGLDRAILEINQTPGWAGTDTEETLYEDDVIRTAFEVNVEDVDAFHKLVTVTGSTYAPKSNPTPRNTRRYEVELRGVGGGDFSLVTGVGGLVLKNNAKIVDGRVFVNGTITMSNHSQIGLDLLGIPIIPVEVTAAHHSCPNPADSTYPRQCEPGEDGEPIDISDNAKIYGEVRANNQTDGTSMFAPGLVSNCVPPTFTIECVEGSDLPEYDREAHKAATQGNPTMTANQADCGLLPLKTWPANTRIDGNVTISGLCIITVEGDVWITGSLTLRNSAILIVKSDLSQPPVIMIDGQDGLNLRNAASLIANLSGVGFRMITFASTAACSPDCVDVTGVDLFNSSSLTTINIQNSASAGRTEFYARWSKINVSNSGNIGALVGQTIELSNSAAITFGARVSGFTAPSAWVVESYKRVFD